MIEAQVRIGAVAHGDDQCVMNGLGALEAKTWKSDVSNSSLRHRR